MAEFGRTEQMVSASERVREPQFQTMQVGAGRGGYRRTSVLDTLQPTGNGMSGQDRQRLLYGVKGSSLGLSTDSFDKSLWLPRTQGNPLYRPTLGDN